MVAGLEHLARPGTWQGTALTERDGIAVSVHHRTQGEGLRRRVQMETRSSKPAMEDSALTAQSAGPSSQALSSASQRSVFSLACESACSAAA